MKKTIKIIVALCVILILFSFTFTIKATKINPDNYKPGSIDDKDMKVVTDKFVGIVYALRIAGVAVTVVVLIILGIK